MWPPTQLGLPATHEGRRGLEAAGRRLGEEKDPKPACPTSLPYVRPKLCILLLRKLTVTRGRNLRSRNQEVELLREQLMRFREVDGKPTSTIDSNSNSKNSSDRKSQFKNMEMRSKTSSRGSPKTKAVPTKRPNKWMPSGYEIGRSVSPLGEGNSGNHQLFDNYQDSDDSISFASASSPGHHSLQSGETDLDNQTIYDDHARLSPLPSTYNSIHPCEEGCSNPGEDPLLPMQPSYPTFDYETRTTNHQHLAPIPHHHPSPRYATPIELSHSATTRSDGENRFCYGYPANSGTEPMSALVSIQPPVTDFPAPARGTHSHKHDTHAGERSRNYAMEPLDAVNIHPALLYNTSPPPQGPTPGSQPPAWPGMSACTVLSLLHMAVMGGYPETVRLILDRWPELAHLGDAGGYTAVQRAIMSGRDDVISMFVH